MRSAMEPGGVLNVVDPYLRGRLGFSAALVVAKRAARRQPQVTTRWFRATSLDAAAPWDGEIDACVIDGVHTPAGVRGDWHAWGRFVRQGGVLVARNDVAAPHKPAEERARELVGLAAPDPAAWRVVATTGSFTAYERCTPPPANA